MIKIKLLLFGITSDLLATSSLELELPSNSTIQQLKDNLLKTYSQLENIDSYAIAVNEEYASNEMVVKENDVIAIIPPVSGG
jgi:molybdopterin converting factor subunit 1